LNVQADEAILIGPAPSAESYLKIENVLDAMKRTGSEVTYSNCFSFLDDST
jgi:acetyl/propionyl-CoA carboxylase alpha subunit